MFVNDSLFSCNGTTQVLDVLGTWNSYLWNTGDTLASLNTFLSGTYSVIVTDSLNCQILDTVVVVFNDTILQVHDTVFCLGDIILFEGLIISSSGTYSFVYPMQNGCDSTIMLNAVAEDSVLIVVDTVFCNGSVILFEGQTIDSTGTYYFNYFTSTGCDSTIVLNTNTNPAVQIDIDTVFCNGDIIILEGQSISSPGIYSFNYLTTIGCDSVVVYNVEMDDDVIVLIDTSFCDGEIIIFEGQTISNAGVYSSIYVLSSGCDSTIVLNASINSLYYLSFDTSFCEGTQIIFEGQTISTSGDYTFSYLTINGCDSIIVLHAQIEQGPTVSLPEDITLCYGEFYTLFPILGGTWETSGWTDFHPSLSRLISEEGVYIYEAIGNCGTAQDDIIISFDSCLSEIWFPNVFTPNGDVHNPVFKPEGMNILDFHMMIFNRWGQMLYETSDMEAGWDGSFRGKEVPEGVYFWVVNYSLYRDSQIVKEENQGSVTLFR